MAAATLRVHHDVDHHNDGDGVGDDAGEVRADVVLQPQADGVEEAEHQRREVGLGGIRRAEDDAGKGDVAAGVGHILGKGAVEVAERQVSARERAQHAAEDAREPLHFFRLDAGGAQRLGLFAARAQPEAVGGFVDEHPQHEDEEPGEIHKQRVAVEHRAEEWNFIQQRKVHRRQGGEALRAGGAEHRAGEIGRQAEREGIERAADDELV